MRKISSFLLICFLVSSIALLVNALVNQNLVSIGLTFGNILYIFHLFHSENVRRQLHEQLDRLLEEFAEGGFPTIDECDRVLEGTLSINELRHRLSVRQHHENPFKLTEPELFAYHHCRFAARSPYLRCAVNPEGPCNDCQLFERKG